MGHLQSSLDCSSQAVSTGAQQQQLLSKTVGGVGGAGRSGFLPPHLHDALGSSNMITDPRFSSTSALDTPFRPVRQCLSALHGYHISSMGCQRHMWGSACEFLLAHLRHCVT